MTGNSLDAADAVLSDFADDGTIADICAHSLPYPTELRQRLLQLRKLLQEKDYDIACLPQAYLQPLIDDYTALVAQTVRELLQKAEIAAAEVAALGFHGQTCGHFPPSLAGGRPAYTLQIGNPQLLADATAIPVIYDFRSDDVMNGGEGAPLAPMHNLHIAAKLLQNGRQSVAFCNGGNTGNIAVVSGSAANAAVRGWDIGPFNHLPDKLMREYQNLPCDKDGVCGGRGRVCADLLRHYFNTAACNGSGENFYLLPPPKSSDPAWYRLCYDHNFAFADNLRTAEYLSAYGFVYNLSYLQKLPDLFLLFGGGWKNPLIKSDFAALLQGKGLILPEHQAVFAEIFRRLPPQTEVAFADQYGYSGEYMEARIFADMAWAKIINRPFSRPEITNCRQPTVGGVYVLPSARADCLLPRLLAQYGNCALPEAKPQCWSRAAKNWQKSA